MKYLLIFLFFITASFAQSTYGYGNIDMHGGKKAPLINNKNSSFENKQMGMSNFLDKKPTIKEIKKEKKKQKEVKNTNDNK